MFERITKSIKKQGYNQGQIDHTIFMKYTSSNKISILIVYVDNIILTGNDEMELTRLK